MSNLVFCALLLAYVPIPNVLSQQSSITDVIEFPYQARLRGCGGTVYNQDWIITAAHCVIRNGELIDLSKEIIKVTLGDADDEDNTFEVDKMILKHFAEVDAVSDRVIPQKRFYNDFALLKLDRSIDFVEQPSIRALRIAPPNFRPEEFSDTAVILEWGNDGLLYKTNVPILKDDTCLDPGQQDKHEQFLCFGGGGNSIGDSGGGPAICRGRDGANLLCGVNSLATENPEGGNRCPPNVFTDVGYFHNWVVEHAGPQDPDSLDEVKLYGGTVPEDKYIHQVHVTTDDGKKCGGTLVTQDTVVTAAQCVFTDDKRTRSGVVVDTKLRDVRNGVHSQNRYIGTRQIVHGIGFARDYSVEKVNISSCTNDNLIREGLYTDDFALIKLDRKVDIQPDQLPKLPALKSFRPGEATEVSFPQDTKRTGTLTQRTFMILSESACQENLRRVGLSVDTSKIMCATEKYSGGSTCDRELGGGLFCRGKRGNEFFCGVQTFRLCGSSVPNLFPSVGKYMTMINILTNL